MTPLCTIAIPAYNRPEATCRALESALAQNTSSVEVLVVDDISGDGTWEAVQAFAPDASRRYPHPRLRLVQNERNLGLFGNFNRCLELAEGKYVRLLCNDDRLTPNCIGPETAFMDAHPDVAMLSTRGWFVNEAGERSPGLGDDLACGIYERDDLIRAALWTLACYGHNAFNYPSGVLLRRDAALAAGRFDAGWKLVSDMDFWLRVSAQGRVAFVDTVGCEVMLHADQMGDTVLLSGLYVKEWFALLERWRSCLTPPSLYDDLEAQMAAYALWFALSFRRKGRPDVARIYINDALGRGISRVRLARAFERMLRYKALARLGRRVQPGVAFEPLTSPSALPPPAPEVARS